MPFEPTEQMVCPVCGKPLVARSRHGRGAVRCSHCRAVVPLIEHVRCPICGKRVARPSTGSTGSLRCRLCRTRFPIKPLGRSKGVGAKPASTWSPAQQVFYSALVCGLAVALAVFLDAAENDPEAAMVQVACLALGLVVFLLYGSLVALHS